MQFVHWRICTHKIISCTSWNFHIFFLLASLLLTSLWAVDKFTGILEEYREKHQVWDVKQVDTSWIIKTSTAFYWQFQIYLQIETLLELNSLSKFILFFVRMKRTYFESVALSHTIWSHFEFLHFSI